MRRLIFPLAVSLCLLAVVSQQSTALAKETWVSVRTKNFFIVGNSSEKDIRRVGLKLEQFREVFTRLFPNMKFNTPVPTTVIVFKSQASYRPFKAGANTAGYFQPGPDVNYITLTTEQQYRENPFNLIFHEYTHLLVNNTFDKAPLWFNEGLAEYYSTFSIEDDQKVVLGRPIAGHVFKLRESNLLPLQTLFEVDHKSPHYNERNKQSIFYAQSWALMHYLIVGKAGRVEQLSKFLELVNTKVPTDGAFQEAFGMTFQAMETELRNYVRQTRYNIVRGHFEKKLELDTTTEAAVLSEAEAQAYLGDLLLHSNRADAYTYLEKAVKLDPNVAMAHASLGMAYFREGKVKEARSSLERAVAANSQNYLAHYYYAFTLSRSSPDEGPVMTGYPPEVAEKIREHLQKAIALRPDYPESYNLLAYVSMVTGKDVDESVASLKRVLSESPGMHNITYMLGQLYAHKGDLKTAIELLEGVAKSNAEERLRSQSEGLMTQLREIEEKRAQYQTVRGTQGSGPGLIIKTETQKEEPTDPSQYLREVLRKPAQGETQLQATLVKIECDAKGIVFVVQTATGLLKLRTASFDEIELTTYDSNMRGEITCGERKPANVVVVCYIPNTDKKLRIDGTLKSIEFVPSDFKLKP